MPTMIFGFMIGVGMYGLFESKEKYYPLVLTVGGVAGLLCEYMN